MGPPPPPPPPDSRLDSKVAVFGYLFICLNIFFFTYLDTADKWAFDALNREDGWTESLTAALLLLAGLLLFSTAAQGRKFSQSWLYALGGIAFVFACGEEISWGQRIFGWTTPEFLRDLNAQGETNLHNLNTAAFSRIQTKGTTLLCMAAGFAILFRQDRLFAIPLPSPLLTLGFILVQSYENYDAGAKTANMFFSAEGGLLLLLGVSALACGQRKWLAALAATLVAIMAFYYQYDPDYFYFGKKTATQHEAYEYLFSFACLLYAVELWSAQRHRGPLHAAARPMPGRRFPFLPAACILVCAGGVGLVLSEYMTSRAKAAAIEKTYRSILSSEPDVRTDFDIYLLENQLVYFKEPCTPADTAGPFFVKISSVAPNGLPGAAKRASFNHYFERHGVRFDGRCLTAIPLPDWEVAHIRIGQYVDGGDLIWRADIQHPGYAADRLRRIERDLADSAAKRSIQGAFDVHLDASGRRLFYVRSPCRADDVTARFFLHVFPVNADDLPPDHQKFGFDNLDFGFHSQGVMAHKRCAAVRQLPGYTIGSIRTGQFTREGQIWTGEARLR